MSEKPEVKFVLMTQEEHPERFLLVRNVGEWSTHYMDPEGQWVALPEEDDDLAQMFENLSDPKNLPQWDIAAVEEYQQENQ